MTLITTSKELSRRAHRIADAACIADLESGATPQTDAHGQRWYDTRPMFDPREVPDTIADMYREALDYLILRRAVEAHPLHAHLVRITVRDTA